MGRRSNSESASGWRGHLERQRRSGLSIVEYCRQEGIGVSTFYAWKRRLKVRPQVPSKTRVGRNSNRSDARREPRECKDEGSFVRVPLAMRSTIEVRFSDGTLVSLPSDNLAALATTLKTLRATQLERSVDD